VEYRNVTLTRVLYALRYDLYSKYDKKKIEIVIRSLERHRLHSSVLR